MRYFLKISQSGLYDPIVIDDRVTNQWALENAEIHSVSSKQGLNRNFHSVHMNAGNPMQIQAQKKPQPFRI